MDYYCYSGAYNTHAAIFLVCEAPLGASFLSHHEKAQHGVTQ